VTGTGYFHKFIVCFRLMRDFGGCRLLLYSPCNVCQVPAVLIMVSCNCFFSCFNVYLQAVTIINAQRDKEERAKKEREVELAKVSIKKEDVDLIVSALPRTCTHKVCTYLDKFLFYCFLPSMWY